MTDLLAQVTPLTVGIIWIFEGEISPQKNYYKQIDYLLNGLLTATLNSTPSDTHVLISNNFGTNFYVLAGNVTGKNLENFFDLVKPHLLDEKSILLIDEKNSYKEFKKNIQSNIQNKIQLIQ